jgi:MAF protein
LAEAKARSVAHDHPHAFVIGSDQVAVAPSGAVLDKPGSTEKASAQLRQLSGHTHSLITGLAVIYLGQTFRAHEVIEVTLRDLTLEEIDAYVAQDDPWDCAGAYKLEQLGICLVNEIKGRDPSSIQGLPMMALSEAFLELLGVLPFQLKQRPPLMNTGESHD